MQPLIGKCLPYLCINLGQSWFYIGMPAPRERTGLSEALVAQIRAERSAARLTLREVSQQSGIPFSTYRKLDDGTGTPDAEQLYRLCQVYGITLREFFSRVEGRLAAKSQGGAGGSAYA